ncbi:cytochrome P450 [Mangrovimicrobium sediminis]|uniref:Cytochrome P450 n=1 Tax=Mangrovimicrobium sediminis TaxID=2562682 RepID=A0A4Z0M801_9GAMM|nr:cytochrome P450 [Haliea sp. SAOS-164]TGD75639.1 cytochrome P450 [Haliea sp. SAOS-164]
MEQQAQDTERDYFTDLSVLRDPYEYFESIRERGGVFRSTLRNLVVVTGFEESVEVLRNTEDFSSANAPQGPAVPLPFTPEGDNITDQIEAHRGEFLGGDLLVAYDGQQHKFSRSILNKLFTPSRLKANEEFIQSYSAQLIDEMVAKGGCELINEVATPFVTLVIADLLGVPADDREHFREVIDNAPPPGNMEADAPPSFDENSPLVVMGTYFFQYVMDRRENPREDILSELSNATYPDGSTPDALEIVRLATFLFGAGQDTSAKLLGNSIRRLAEDHALQDELRADPRLIPAFIEEVLRMEGSTKMTARLAVRDTSIAGLPVAAGTPVMIAVAAANRDPKRWENPEAFDMQRPRLREHLAFGRGAHTCAGAPLARVEVRILLEHLLAKTSRISLDEAHHGPQGARELDYEPSFIIRGLSKLHLVLAP